MKKIILIGNVGKNASLVNYDGDSFATFSLAVTSGRKENQITEWYDVSCDGIYKDIALEQIKKGSKIYLEGKPSTKIYTGKDGMPKLSLKVTVKEMRLLNYIADENVEAESESNNG